MAPDSKATQSITTVKILFGVVVAGQFVLCLLRFFAGDLPGATADGIAFLLGAMATCECGGFLPCLLYGTFCGFGLVYDTLLGLLVRHQSIFIVIGHKILAGTITPSVEFTAPVFSLLGVVLSAKLYAQISCSDAVMEERKPLGSRGYPKYGKQVSPLPTAISAEFTTPPLLSPKRPPRAALQRSAPQESTQQGAAPRATSSRTGDQHAREPRAASSSPFQAIMSAPVERAKLLPPLSAPQRTPSPPRLLPKEGAWPLV